MPAPDHPNKSLTKKNIARLLGIIVHDVRNPLSTIQNNVDYLLETAELDEDMQEALDDMVLAVDDLRAGLERVAWVAEDWLEDQPAQLAQSVQTATDSVGSVHHVLEKVLQGIAFEVQTDIAEGAWQVQGAGALPDILEILLGNAHQYAGHQPKPIELRVYLQENTQENIQTLIMDVIDEGPVVPVELRGAVLDALGQPDVKARPEGRYERFVGLAAAAARARSVGARLEVTSSEDGKSVLRLYLQQIS